MLEQYNYAFLHGGIQGGWVWEEVLAALVTQTSNRFGQALVLDVPGCGSKRGRATDEIELEQVAQELLSDIEGAGLREVVLVGHSQAGTVLPMILSQRPALFRRAIYVSCIAPLPGHTVLEFSATHLGVTIEADKPPDLAAMFCNDMTPPQAAAFLGKLGEDAWPARAYETKNWTYERLNEVPASYICCLRDATVPPLVQEGCAERLKATKLIRIDAGHQVMNSRPHALTEALRLEAADNAR